MQARGDMAGRWERPEAGLGRRGGGQIRKVGSGRRRSFLLGRLRVHGGGHWRVPVNERERKREREKREERRGGRRRRKGRERGRAGLGRRRERSAGASCVAGEGERRSGGLLGGVGDRDDWSAREHAGLGRWIPGGSRLGGGGWRRLRDGGWGFRLGFPKWAGLAPAIIGREDKRGFGAVLDHRD